MILKIKCRHCEGITTIKVNEVERLREENTKLKKEIQDLEMILSFSGGFDNKSTNNAFNDIFSKFSK